MAPLIGNRKFAILIRIMSNKESAIQFLKLASSGQVQEAYDSYVAEDFYHHNPWFAGDRDSLMAAMKDNARQSPNLVFEVKRALEDGDLVAVHSHVRQKPEDRGDVIVHIFRFEGDKIAELWDTSVPIPDDGINEHGII